MEILYGLISNFVFNILNKIGEVIYGEILNKRNKKQLIKEINEKFKIKNENINIDNLKEFFSISQIKDTIEEYILYSSTAQRALVKPNKKLNIPLKKEELFRILSNKYSIIYNCDSDELEALNDCFEFIYSFCEEKTYQFLKKNEKATIHFINSYTETNYNLIEQQLKIISKNIDALVKTDIEKFNPNFSEIKNKYYKILKERYSQAHIYLLDKFPFDSFYVPPTLLYSPNNKLEGREMIYFESYSPQMTWDKIFIKNNIVYVIGGAGYGKSLFLKKIINDYKNLSISDAEEYLVIFGELKMFFQKDSKLLLPVDKFLRDSMQSNTLLGDEISIDFIRYYLNKGRCIILLDALDEVDKKHRKDLHEKIIAYFKSQNPKNRICITSRDRGFIPEKNIEVYHIKPLDHNEIEKYVDNIIKLGKFDKQDKYSFMEQTSSLIEKGFLNSFLVLSLLLNIYKAERELPENKLDLYSKCFEYITVKREKEKTSDRFDWQKISLLMKDNTFMALSQLGFPNNRDIEKDVIISELTNIYKSKYSNENETINAIEEFLRFCSDRTELFVPSNSDGKFKFFHRSFFEYFYSLNLFINYTSPSDLLNKFKSFDIDSEVFELTMSMFKQRAETKYQEILKLIISESENELKYNNNFIYFNILTLIMQIVDDVQYKEYFFNLIIEYKNKIYNNIKKFYNLNCLPLILNGFKKYSELICKAYYKESISAILEQLSFVFAFDERGTSLKSEPAYFEELNYRRFIIHHRQYPLFYLNLFIKNYDLLKELNSLDKNKLIELGIKDKKLLKCFEDFNTISKERQKALLKNIQ